MSGQLAAIARRLGGEVVGAQVLCPGPGHSRRDRSLSVRISVTAPDGFVVHSHCGDDWKICRDYVLGRLGITSAQSERGASPAVSAHRTVHPRPVGDDDEAAAKIRRAAAIWQEAVNPVGTLVERYLASRKLPLPYDVAGSAIRFHPACAWRDEATGEVVRVPAMIAAFRNIHSDEITGVHRTALTAGGVKIGRRMLGIAAGAAIKLDANDAVTMGLVIGEGIETCLAARQLGFRPVWAMGSVGAIASFPVLSGIDALILLAETGDSGASERAVHECGARWEAAGQEAIVATPRDGGDINDAIRGAA